jgi:hypothetical protein
VRETGTGAPALAKHRESGTPSASGAAALRLVGGMILPLPIMSSRWARARVEPPAQVSHSTISAGLILVAISR